MPGDYLVRIATEFYGDPNKWRIIYEANVDVIGPDGLLHHTDYQPAPLCAGAKPAIALQAALLPALSGSCHADSVGAVTP
jgi:hypothetical protein